MKKFLAIFTIVAMLSGMCTIGASAAVASDALSATLELAGGSNVFREDFSQYDYVTNTLSYQPANSNFVGLKNDYTGVHALAQGDVSNSGDSWYLQSVSTYQAVGNLKERGFAIRVPEFFKDKPEGEYTIIFDVGRAGTEAFSQKTLNYAVLDVGATVNAGSIVYDVSPVAAAVNDPGAEWTWTTVEIKVNWDGPTEIIETDDIDPDNYDPYALCMYLVRQNGGREMRFDNIVITSPEAPTSVKATNTISGDFEDNVLINALYDEEGNLVSVDTKELTASDNTAELKLPYTGEAKHNWIFKAFIWSDLDNEIEPIAESNELELNGIAPNYTFTEDFEKYENWNIPYSTSFSIDPSSSRFIALKANKCKGILPVNSINPVYTDLKGWQQSVVEKVETNGLTGAESTMMQTMGFGIYLPEFFKGRTAGTYTLEFDYYDNGSSLWQPLRAGIIDIGTTVNTGAPAYMASEQPVSVCDGSATNVWKHASVTFTYNGSVTAIEATDNIDPDDYDAYGLCIFTGRNTNGKYYIDNLKITFAN